MALSLLNLGEGKVELVHRFSALSEELEEIVARPEAPASVRPLRKLLPLGKAAFETPVFRYVSMVCNSRRPHDVAFGCKLQPHTDICKSKRYQPLL